MFHSCWLATRRNLEGAPLKLFSNFNLFSFLWAILFNPFNPYFFLIRNNVNLIIFIKLLSILDLTNLKVNLSQPFFFTSTNSEIL